MNTVNQTHDSAFFEQWNLYQEVISNNYMFHAEIVAIVQREIAKLEGCVSILELGCGDAYVISKSVAKNMVKEYYGVDASAAALGFARENLEGYGELKLVKNDFLLELESLKGIFEVVIVGYALHHLTTDRKKRFFSRVAEVLAEGGLLIFYDAEMNVGETCQTYNERVCGVYTKEWVTFSKEAIDSICAHVRANDIPENGVFHSEVLRKVGFSVIDKPFRDKNSLFAVYIARR